MSGFNGYVDANNVKKSDIVNNLTSGETMPPSAGCVYDAVTKTIQELFTPARKNLTTTLSYLDISFTLTKPALVLIIAAYNNIPPAQIIIATSNTTASVGTTVATVSNDLTNSLQLVTFLGAGTYYLWAKGTGSGGDDFSGRYCYL